MDVIINNPAPQTAAPTVVAPAAPTFTQGYGVAPQPVYYVRQHDGPGFFGFLLILLGFFALMRLFRWRSRWNRRWANGRWERGPWKGDWRGDWKDAEAQVAHARAEQAHAEQVREEQARAPRREKDAPREGWSDFLEKGRERLFGDRALEILRERFARGEIDADEYERVRRGLTA